MRLSLMKRVVGDTRPIPQLVLSVVIHRISGVGIYRQYYQLT
ncbi:hypothetical protein PSPO01_04648 [Paraphaeosphaeria sporulosa]